MHSQTPAFQNRRFQNWIFLGLMYGFFYMSRYNFSAIAAKVAKEFGWKYTDYGSILSVALLTYGLAVFFNGPIADRIGGKRAILIGAAGAAVFNFLFGLSHLFLLNPARWNEVGTTVLQPATLNYGMKSTTLISALAVIWAGNHYFQSFGALSIVKINAAWFHLKERGRFAGMFGIMIQSGKWLAYNILPLTLLILPWQYVFFLPAIVLSVMWVVCYYKVADSPLAAGHGEFHTGDETAEEEAVKPTFGFILKKILARPTPWLIAFTSMCIGMVRNAIDHWYITYYDKVFHIRIEKAGFSKSTLIVNTSMVVAAVLGGIAAGNISDRFFSSRRAPIICFAFIGQAFCLLGLRLFWDQIWIASAMIILISFFIQSAHSLVGGAASMDFGGRKAVATAAGLFDGAQYLAGAIVLKSLGRILDRFTGPGGIEFSVWPLVPLPFAFIGAILISRLWNVVPGRKGAH